jgi:chemotaxis protein methyltransferase CheR
LATDGPFNEFQVILSGEVLGWFNESLQERVLALFHQSLTRFGILGLGGQGTPHAAVGEVWYEALAGTPGFYRKVK